MTKQGIAAASKTEINLLRLLSRCESFATDCKAGNEWRVVKYVETLQSYLQDLRKLAANAPSPEALTDYDRRIELLKGILAAEKLSSSSEKSLKIELLVPGKQQTGRDGDTSRDLYCKTKARYQSEARAELLGLSSQDAAGETGVTHRRPPGGQGAGSGAEEDVDTLLRHHKQEQERLAENMVILVRNLKENARIAGRIVKDDRDKLVESSHLADSNYSRLHVESVRLEHHANKACSWWIFLTLIVVIAVFIWMVIFMKMFSKK